MSGVLPLNERQAERQFDQVANEAIQAGRIARDHVAVLRREGRVIGWRQALANLQAAIAELQPREQQEPRNSRISRESL